MGKYQQGSWLRSYLSKGVGKREPSYTAGRIGWATIENSVEVPQKNEKQSCDMVK